MTTNAVGPILPREPLTLAGAQCRASYHRSRLYDAFAFFRARTGSAVTAIALAKAELWARDQSAAGLLRIIWEDDTDPESWHPGNVCACGACAYCTGERSPESVERCAILARRPESLDRHGERCRRCESRADDCDCPSGWETVASLCGVVDADSDYRRVVAAELALEAMSTV